VSVIAKTEMDHVELLWQRRRVLAGCGFEIDRSHRHRVMIGRESNELRGVAVCVAVGRDAFVDLSD